MPVSTSVLLKNRNNFPTLGALLCLQRLGAPH